MKGCKNERLYDMGHRIYIYIRAYRYANNSVRRGVSSRVISSHRLLFWIKSYIKALEKRPVDECLLVFSFRAYIL